MYVGPAFELKVASAPVIGVHAVQTFELSHVPSAHAAVQVVIPSETPTVSFGVAVAHPPVAKRVLVSDVQVYVGPAFELKVRSAPVIGVHEMMVVVATADGAVSVLVTMVVATAPAAPLAAIALSFSVGLRKLEHAIVTSVPLGIVS